MKLLVITALAAILSACTGPRMVRYAPLQKKTELDAKKLYDAAEGTLLDRGFLIEKREPSEFRLITQPRTLLGSEISKGKFKYVFMVETAGGVVKIRLKCQSESGSHELGACGEEAPEKLVSEQRQIADKAIEEAKSK